jgi:hypothetical protein
MLIRSMTAAETKMTALAREVAAIASARRSRSGAVSALLSSTPGREIVESGMTAAATTGPARQPRPTSSTPATRE